MMMRDEEAGRLVNLTASDAPQDIYQQITDSVREGSTRLAMKKPNGGLGSESIASWLSAPR
jgi:hypothetical protein